MTATAASAREASFEPSIAQAQAAARFADLVVRFGMDVPALLLLEMARPLNRVLSVSLLMMAPSMKLLLGSEEWQQLGLLLEDRRSVEYLLRCIEERIP